MLGIHTSYLKTAGRKMLFFRDVLNDKGKLKLTYENIFNISILELFFLFRWIPPIAKLAVVSQLVFHFLFFAKRFSQLCAMKIGRKKNNQKIPIHDLHWKKWMKWDLVDMPNILRQRESEKWENDLFPITDFILSITWRILFRNFRRSTATKTKKKRKNNLFFKSPKLQNTVIKLHNVRNHWEIIKY